jgi:hypothetical protein
MQVITPAWSKINLVDVTPSEDDNLAGDNTCME